jgi:hypothetical protein
MMSDITRKSSLTNPQRRLVELMQELNFGRIEDLHICGGMPSFDPPPRLIRKFKLDSPDNEARPENRLEDFWLKRPLVQLFDTLSRLKRGKVLRLEVKNGLAFSLEIENAISAAEENS